MSTNPVILSKQNDVVGTDKYRVDDPSIPAAYRPRIDFSCLTNPRGTSNTMTVRSEAPIIKTVDGIVTSSDMFLMVTKFTSLQQVTQDVLRAKIFDDHFMFLHKARADILEGRLPMQAYIW